MKVAPEGNRRIKDSNTTMNMKMIVSKLKDTIIRKRTLFMICFFLLMIIDWTRGSQVGSTWAWTVNMTGVIMAVIMFSSYNIREFNKPVYIVYSLAGIVALPLSYLWWNAHQAIIYRDKMLTAVLNVWLLGVLLIKLIDDVVIQKRKKLHFSKLEIILAGMFLWMFISVNEDVWPIWYLIMFELFYHTDYSSEDMESMKQGLLNGIILAFFVLQGSAFVFRPFDDPHYRYCGIYANCNMNALFYCIVWVAFLLKLYYCRKNAEKKWKEVVCFLFSAVVVGFMIFTICRTAWISVIAVGVIYLIFANYVILKKKGSCIAVSIVTWLLVVGISMPIIYSAIRYIPAVFHHPVWYEGEYSEERVHSFDVWDSEKYVSATEFSGALFERVTPFVEVMLEKLGISMGQVYAYDDKIVAEYDQETMDRFSSTIGRVAIWKYYLQNGTLMGHSSTEGHDIGWGLWYVWHTQNVFVQFWYYYGIPSAILLAIAGIGMMLMSMKQVVQKTDDVLISLLYVVLFGTFGFLECVWYPGQVILFLCFFIFKFLLDNRENGIEIRG